MGSRGGRGAGEGVEGAGTCTISSPKARGPAVAPSVGGMTASSASRTRILGVLALGAVLCPVVVACTPGQPTPAPTTVATASSTPPATEETEVPEGVSEDALAEREAFFDVQGRPVEGGFPTPQTPEQQQFLDEQRAYVESQGGEWDEFYDGIALAVTLDACETSILNGHEVTTEVAAAHIQTSPLIAEISGDDPAAVQGLASIMVFGTGFVCPDDAPQWEAAFTELYG
jgi:hypothetical protein